MVNKKKRKFDELNDSETDTFFNISNSELREKYNYCEKEKKFKISKEKWISPSSLRNFVYDDCILDYLTFLVIDLKL